MKKKKQANENIEQQAPWGTPTMIGLGVLKKVPTWTVNVLSDKKLAIQLTM